MTSFCYTLHKADDSHFATHFIKRMIVILLHTS